MLTGLIVIKHNAYFLDELRKIIIWPEMIKLFSCSTQLSMKFQLLIKTKMLKNEDFSCFQTLSCCIYHANNKFHAQLSVKKV